MSGGSYDYLYSRVDDTYCGKMFDPAMDELMADLVDVLHDLEWWRSNDTAEEDYRDTVATFKAKWMRSPKGVISAARKALQEATDFLRSME